MISSRLLLGNTFDPKKKSSPVCCTVAASAVHYRISVLSESELDMVFKREEEAVRRKRELNAAAAAVAEGKGVGGEEAVVSDGGWILPASTTPSEGKEGPLGSTAPADGTTGSTEAADSDLLAALALEQEIGTEGWSCQLCTFRNSPEDARCGICDAARPDSTSAGTATAGGSSADASTAPAVAAGVGWWCSVCTYINPLTARR